MSKGKDPADGHPSLQRFNTAFLGLLHGHAELFGVKLQEQKTSTLCLLLFTRLALVFTLFLLVSLSLLVSIMFWDTSRLIVVFGLCLFYMIGSLFCNWRLYQSINDESSPLSATLGELANNRERLLPRQGNAHKPTTGERDRLVALRTAQGDGPPAPGNAAPAIVSRKLTAGATLSPGPGAGPQPRPATVRR